MTKHIATHACFNSAGNRVGTGYLYSVDDIVQKRDFYTNLGKPFHLRWRNEKCRSEHETVLAAKDTAPDLPASRDGGAT